MTLQKLLSKNFTLCEKYEELDNLSPIIYAAKYGITNYLSTCLSSINGDALKTALANANNNGLTALHFACRYGRTEAVKLLVNYGALSTATKSSRELPIHLIFNDINNLATMEDLFMLLVNEGAIHAKTLSGQTIAHLAATKNSTPILKTIYQLKPDALNEKDNFSRTPLFYAVANNQLDTASFLLENSDLSIQNSKGQNALHIAVLLSTNEMLGLVLPYFDVNQCDNEKNSALDLANSLDFKDKQSILDVSGKLQF